MKAVLSREASMSREGNYHRIEGLLLGEGVAPAAAALDADSGEAWARRPDRSIPLRTSKNGIMCMLFCARQNSHR